MKIDSDVASRDVHVQRRIEALVASSVEPLRYSALLRGCDLLAGGTALVLTLPLLAIICVTVALTSKGPAIFRQVRVGKGGRPFTFFKIRSMVTDAERLGPYWTADEDPRVTVVGRLLRVTSLDELPQLWNVVRGDMSLVGPRPIVPAQQDLLSPSLLALRHQVRPGITGWAQTSGRSSLTPDETMYFDLKYAVNPNLQSYLRILGRTVASVLVGRGTN